MKNPLDRIFQDSIRLDIKIASTVNTEKKSSSGSINWTGRLKDIGEIDKCPHCKKQLINIPERKRKCEFCGDYIYVRTRPADRKRVLVTEDQTTEIEDQWTEVYTVNKWVDSLSYYGITGQDYQKAEEQLSKQFGFKVKPNDVIWSILNELVTKQKDWHSLKMLYFKMALFLNDEGKDSFDMLAEAAKCELMNYKEINFVQKVAISSARGCEECKKTDGQTFTLEEAFKIMPIPNRKCTFRFSENQPPFCRCRYVVKFD